MGKQFIVAIIRANGTRWNVQLSDSREGETFVAKDGALGYVLTLGRPVQALVYRRASDEIEEAWFYENGSRRKLDVLTLPDTSKRGNW